MEGHVDNSWPSSGSRSSQASQLGSQADDAARHDELDSWDSEGYQIDLPAEAAAEFQAATKAAGLHQHFPAGLPESDSDGDMPLEDRAAEIVVDEYAVMGSPALRQRRYQVPQSADPVAAFIAQGDQAPRLAQELAVFQKLDDMPLLPPAGSSYTIEEWARIRRLRIQAKAPVIANLADDHWALQSAHLLAIFFFLTLIIGGIADFISVIVGGKLVIVPAIWKVIMTLIQRTMIFFELAPQQREGFYGPGKPS